MNINQIRYFLDVAETGSINQSALNLYISPQGLSRSIAQLEKGLGFCLFARSNRGMVLTEEGRVFLEPARKIREAYRQFERETSVISAHSPSWTQESLDLQVPPLLSISNDLGQLLSLIDKQYPTLCVNIIERNSFDMVPYAQSLTDEQLRRTCMVATVPDYRIPSYLNTEKFSLTKICEFPMSVYVEKRHRLATRQNVTRSEIAQERIVLYNEPTVEEIVHHLLDEFGEPNVVFRGSITNFFDRFPDEVLISAGGSRNVAADNIVEIPIKDTVNVHIVAITATPEPPIMSGIIECLRHVVKRPSCFTPTPLVPSH